MCCKNNYYLKEHRFYHLDSWSKIFWDGLYFYKFNIYHFSFLTLGFDPHSLRGSKTGVFVGASESEAHQAWSSDPETTVGYHMTGCARSMFANRLSYYFDFKGKNYAVFFLV